MNRNVLHDGLSQPERLFAVGGFFFLVMALISNLGQFLLAPDLASPAVYHFAWSKIYFCLALIMGIIALNYLGIRGGWLIKLNPRLSQMHFWLTFTGVCLVLINMENQLYQEAVATTAESWWTLPKETDAGAMVSLFTWKPNMALSIYIILLGQFIWAGNFIQNLLLGNHMEG